MLTVTTGGPGSIRDTRLRMDLRPAVPGQDRKFLISKYCQESGRSSMGLTSRAVRDLLAQLGVERDKKQVPASF